MDSSHSRTRTDPATASFSGKSPPFTSSSISSALTEEINGAKSGNKNTALRGQRHDRFQRHSDSFSSDQIFRSSEYCGSKNRKAPRQCETKRDTSIITSLLNSSQAALATIIYLSLTLISFAVTLDATVRVVFQTTATSSLQKHPYIATLGIVRAVLAFAVQPTFAKFGQEYGQLPLATTSLVIYVIGTLVQSYSTTIATFTVGTLLYQTGYTGFLLLIDIIAAGLVDPRWRLLSSIAPTVPTALVSLVSGPITSVIGENWGLGIRMWVAILPIVGIPLIMCLGLIQNLEQISFAKPEESNFVHNQSDSSARYETATSNSVTTSATQRFPETSENVRKIRSTSNVNIRPEIQVCSDGSDEERFVPLNWDPRSRRLSHQFLSDETQSLIKKQSFSALESAPHSNFALLGSRKRISCYNFREHAIFIAFCILFLFTVISGIFIMNADMLISQSEHRSAFLILIPLISGTLGIVLLFVWQYKYDNQFLPAYLFSSSRVWSSLMVALLTNLTWSLIAVYAYTVLLVAVDESVNAATFIISVFGLSAVVIGPLIGLVAVYARRLKPLVVFGATLWISAMIIFVVHPGGKSVHYQITGAYVLLGISSAFTNYPCQTLLQSIVPEDDLGMVTGLYLCFFQLGSLIGSSIAGTIWQAVLAPGIRAVVPQMVAEMAYEDPIKFISEYSWNTAERQSVVEVYKRTQQILAGSGLVSSVLLLFDSMILANPLMS